MKRIVVALTLLMVALSAIGEEWLVLQGTKGPPERVLSIRPRLPSASVMAAFPIEVKYCKTYRPASNGLPQDDAELLRLYEHERALRALDPKETVFLQAMRETGSGRRCWTHYTMSTASFQKMVANVREFADSSPSFRSDERWSALRDFLARTRR